MSLLTSLAGPVLGLVGNLFGSKKKKEEVVNRVDYARMVADAEAAGFNPLTALRNGGAAGFSVTSQPVLSSKHAAIGDAIGSIGNFISNFDPFEDKLREAQYGVMQMQLSNLQSNTMAAPRRMFDVPAVTGRTREVSGPKLLPGPWLEPPAATPDALPVWVPGFDRDGHRMWVPNPEGPDLEQVAGAWVLRSQSGWERFAGAALDPGKHVKSRRLTREEENAREKSWWPKWLPSISYR